ncbi:MAG: exodeoxyribonuclease VII small subunit [Syntrophales bacterium]
MAKDKFEEALKKLEELVKRMESGDLALDDSLKAFEEGIRLIRFCTGKLDEAERRVEILIKNGQGDFTTAPFPRDEGDA